MERRKALLAELFDRLKEIIEDAHRPSILTNDLLPGKLLVLDKGGITQIDAGVKPHNGNLYDFESVHAFCIAHDPVELFVSEAGVQIVPLDGDRRSEVFVPFNISDRFVQLLRLDGKGFTPREAVRFLRFALEIGDHAVIDKLSKVSFSRKSDGTSTVDHGRESLGRSVEAAVAEASEIPKSFKYSLPVFTNPGFRHMASLEIGIYLDLDSELIRLIPSNDGLQMAKDAAVSSIIGELHLAMPLTPIYFGQDR
jgi:hypothetical protein